MLRGIPLREGCTLCPGFKPEKSFSSLVQALCPTDLQSNSNASGTGRAFPQGVAAVPHTRMSVPAVSVQVFLLQKDRAAYFAAQSLHRRQFPCAPRYSESYIIIEGIGQLRTGKIQKLTHSARGRREGIMAKRLQSDAPPIINLFLWYV